MSKERYFKKFWINAKNGKRLFPVLITNRDSGVQRYQLLAKGTNDKADGDETIDPVVAVRRFLNGESLRFGNDSTPANRFDVDGGAVDDFGMTPELWLQLR